MRNVALLGILPLVALACGDDTPRPQRVESARPTPVTVVRAQSAGAVAGVSATGVVAPKDEMQLSFKIGGIVAEVLVDEGAAVERGQVLARLDVREIDAAVAKASAAAEKAQRDLARAERLFRDSVVTQSQLLDARTARDVAEADLRAARVNREFAVVTAPVRGRVLKRIVNPGMLAAPGSPVLSLASNARGTVLRAGMADRDAMYVRVGQRAEVVFDAYAGAPVAGRVRQIAPSADPRTGSFVVEVSLTSGEQLPYGLIGKVHIVTDSRATRDANGALSVPAEALVEGNDSTGTLFVLAESSSVARRVSVRILALTGDHILVKGISLGARVVVGGASWLRDSTPVEVKP